jgi:hypothetical protein
LNDASDHTNTGEIHRQQQGRRQNISSQVNADSDSVRFSDLFVMISVCIRNDAISLPLQQPTLANLDKQTQITVQLISLILHAETSVVQKTYAL